MTATGITAWDRLVVPYYVSGVVGTGDDEDLLRRQAARLGPFETLVGRARLATSAQERQACARNVGKEFRERLHGFERWYGRPLKDDDLARWLATMACYGGHAAVGVFLWAPVLALVTISRRAIGLGRMCTLRRAVDRRRCPDCRFDLSRTPPGLDQAEAGCWIGPERCPECGGRWPLVPPRVG